MAASADAVVPMEEAPADGAEEPVDSQELLGVKLLVYGFMACPFVFPKANNCYSAASCPLRLEILKDILDEWIKARSLGSSFSRAAVARRTEEPWQIV